MVDAAFAAEAMIPVEPSSRKRAQGSATRDVWCTPAQSDLATFDELLVPDARFVEATRVMPFAHRASRMPVDVVLAGPGLEEQFLARAEIRKVGDIAIPVASAEDLITMKILAGRARDLEDVAAVARAHREDLDLQQIRATLRLLEGALDRADLVIELERILRAIEGPAEAGP